MVKQVVRALCKEIHEKFICPINSDVLEIEIKDDMIKLTCEDGSKFAFPEGDCIQLPIKHSSVEEIAAYLCTRIVDSFTAEDLLGRGVQTIAVTVSEVRKKYVFGL